MTFYVLKRAVDVLRYETEFFYVEPHAVKDPPKCRGCGKYEGCMIPLPPYKLALELWDKGFGDIAYGPGDHLLVTERFRCLWEEHGLAGLEGFYPVSIRKVIRHKRLKGDLPSYFLVEVCQSEAMLDHDASGCEWDIPPTCPVCREGGIKRWKKHVLIPGTWQGENIFRPKGLSGSIMTDQRFADFAREFNITNCHLIPAEEYAHDFYPWENELTVPTGTSHEMAETYVVVDDDVIDEEDVLRIIEPVWWSVNIYEGQEKYERDLGRFSIPQRHVFAVWWYKAEVENGGHRQFYSNSTGIVWGDALRGLDEIGLHKHRDILKRSVERLGGRPSKDREARRRQLDKVEPNFEDLDKEFDVACEDENIDVAILEYILKNRQDFYFNGFVEKPKEI